MLIKTELNIMKGMMIYMFKLVRKIIGGVYGFFFKTLKTMACLPVALVLLLLGLMPLYLICLAIKHFQIVLIALVILGVVIYAKKKNS